MFNLESKVSHTGYDSESKRARVGVYKKGVAAKDMFHGTSRRLEVGVADGWDGESTATTEDSPPTQSLDGESRRINNADAIQDDRTFPIGPKKKKGRNSERKRHGARNQDRHKNFVKWLTERFDLSSSVVDDEVLHVHIGTSATQHILDVAGGKGEVSARLAMCQRQHVVMVDPRPANVVDCFKTLVLPKIPNKWQQKLEQQLQEDSSFVEKTIEKRFRQLVTSFDETSLSSSMELQSAVEHASLLLGLHADGATEAIVDAALQYNKPFVVVPCCVFPNFFPHRVMYDEETRMVPVRSHEQFCKYLLNRDARFVMEELPFAGRNIAIWWDGK